MNIHNNVWGPFYWHGLTSIPAWLSIYIHFKMWGEITYPFPNFNSCTFEVWNGQTILSHTL